MNDVEKKILEAGRLQTISKSSDQILETFEVKHKRRIQKRFFFIPTITTLLASATAVAVIFALSPRPIHIQGQTKGFNDGSTVLTSVVGNLSLHYYTQDVSNEQNRIFAAPIVQEEFNQVAMDVDAVYSPYSYYYVHTKGLNYTFDSSVFSYDDVNYRYELSVNNTTVYLKDNLSEIKSKGVYEGLIRVSDTCYPCEINAQVSHNVVSTTFTYRVSSYIHSLTTKTSDEVTTITHQIKINDDISEIKSVSLLNKGKKFSASFKNDDRLSELTKERSFSYISGDDFISVDYRKNETTYSGIKLRVDTSTRARKHVYSFEGVTDVVL